MKVKVIRQNKWEHPGEFPTFEKGTSVILAKDEDVNFSGWYACDIAGYKPYVPKAFVNDGKLIRDYNPTELIQMEGDILEVHEIVYAWLLATNDKGLTGWIPAECVMSINS
ncbi:MAG: SH3 domain-containing protein [Defluviitaleaceae bacterium]|nr:SH3 domain-containing protein [Defluviitaleaceae bacterium]